MRGTSESAWATVSTGTEHTCALDSIGRLYCWGSHQSSQLGTGGTWFDRPFEWPIPIGGTSAWKAIAAGRSHTCGIGIGATGTLSCWGHINESGDATGAITEIALSIPADMIVAGAHHSCVWTPGGQAACWGKNTYGAIGVIGDASPAAPVPLPQTWNHLAVGHAHSCGVAGDRSLWCWGHNAGGQLGDGTHIDRAIPTQIGSERSWTMVAAGAKQSCAIKEDRTLWCWGDNSYGELGTGRAWRAALVEVF